MKKEKLEGKIVNKTVNHLNIDLLTFDVAWMYGISHLYIGFYHSCFAHVCLTLRASFDGRFYVCMCVFSNWTQSAIEFSLFLYLPFFLFVCLVLCISLSVCQRIMFFLLLYYTQTYRYDFDTISCFRCIYFFNSVAS